MSKIKAGDALEVSNHVIRLNQLLAWELATLRPHANNTFQVVRLQIMDSHNTSVFLNTKDLEELISTLVAKELNWLEEHDVDSTEIIEQFRQTANRILGQQQSETPLDKA